MKLTVSINGPAAHLSSNIGHKQVNILCVRMHSLNDAKRTYQDIPVSNISKM